MREDRPLDDFHALLDEAHAAGAGQLFLLPDEPPALRRADGRIERLDRPPLDAGWLRAVCAAVTPETPLDEPFGERTRWYETPDLTAARCAVARTGGRLSLVAALSAGVIPTPEQVQMPRALVESAESGVGLVVFAGLSGSGKTTSAWALLEHFNAHHPCHLCTVEDPIHVRFEPKQALIQQRQIGLDVPDTVTGIRAALRQDLDGLFVSRVDDAEALQACIAAAAGGHLVIIQLEASDVDEAVRRMVDSYPEELRDGARRSLAQVLNAICVQRLLPRQQDGVRRGRVAAYAYRVFDDAARAAVADGESPTATPAGATQRVTMAEALRALHRGGQLDDATFEQALRLERDRD